METLFSPHAPTVAVAAPEAKPTSTLAFGSVVAKAGRLGAQDTLWLVLNPNLALTNPTYEGDPNCVRTIAIQGTNPTAPWNHQDKARLALDSWGLSTDDVASLQVVGVISIDQATQFLRREIGQNGNTELYLGDWKRHLEAEELSVRAESQTEEETLAELAHLGTTS